MSDVRVGKSELVKRIAEQTGEKQTVVKAVVESLFGTVFEIAQSGGVVSLPGIGSFRQVERAARTGRNPRTGESVEYPASKRVAFKASKTA